MGWIICLYSDNGPEANKTKKKTCYCLMFDVQHWFFQKLRFSRTVIGTPPSVLPMRWGYLPGDLALQGRIFFALEQATRSKSWPIIDGIWSGGFMFLWACMAGEKASSRGRYWLHCAPSWTRLKDTDRPWSQFGSEGSNSSETTFTIRAHWSSVQGVHLVTLCNEAMHEAAAVRTSRRGGSCSCANRQPECWKIYVFIDIWTHGPPMTSGSAFLVTLSYLNPFLLLFSLQSSVCAAVYVWPQLWRARRIAPYSKTWL